MGTGGLQRSQDLNYTAVITAPVTDPRPPVPAPEVLMEILLFLGFVFWLASLGDEDSKGCTHISGLCGGVHNDYRP